MAIRTCPHCGATISPAEVAAHSDSLDCPRCQALLQVSSGARALSSVCGLLAGALVWKLSSNAGGMLDAVLPTLYSVLAFGVASPLVLMLAANLTNAPARTQAAPVTAAPVHDSVHH